MPQTSYLHQHINECTIPVLKHLCFQLNIHGFFSPTYMVRNSTLGRLRMCKLDIMVTSIVTTAVFEHLRMRKRTQD